MRRRDDYYQVAYFTAKGSDARLRAEGIERFRERIAHLRPEFANRVAGLASMDEVFVLDVKLNRVKRWYLDMFEKQFAGKRSGPPKAVLFLLRVFPRLRTMPARFVGFGPRPERAPEFARRNS